MAKRAAEMGGKPAQGGGDACCGGDAPPKTPDQLLGIFLPKLTEGLLDVIADKPFANSSTLQISSGSTISYKAEALLTSILAHQRMTTGEKLMEKRKIVTDLPGKTGKAGAPFTVTVRAERLPFVKDGHGASKRIFVCLVNISTKQV